MVRLKEQTYENAVPASVFQFHYGTIKSGRFQKNMCPNYYFNSTMVRLKGCRHQGHDHINQFQFHYGTIKREYWLH